MVRLWLALVAVSVCVSRLPAQSRLHDDLARQPTAELARRARVLGDPKRGALIFHSQSLGCIQCHGASKGNHLLGPNLSELKDRANYLHVVESILRPNQSVLKPYVAEKFLLDDGQIVTGMVREEDDESLVLSVPGDDSVKTIELDSVEVRKPADSVMPVGLVNQLDSESEFFDLVAFVFELGKAGPENASLLIPDLASIAPPPLPAYESDLDHAGLIRSFNDRSFENGKRIYESLCINCHGTKELVGSLPNALRFASGKFKNGSDPLAMYKTLTHGFKMMLPQHQLVPKQKYDVIHYIREAYIKPNNPEQFVAITKSYLDALPKGKLRGPVAVRNEPWKEMDYGPFLISTYEIVSEDAPPRLGITQQERMQARDEDRPPSEVWPEDVNFAYKGIALRLDDGPGGISKGDHWLAFDHDTMRVAGAWSGNDFIDWRGVLFNGNHNMTPRTKGKLHFGSLPGPGWAHPRTGSFDDPRLLGKDGRAYGPLPRDWARYKGLYKHGDRVVVSYSVGDADVLEGYAIENQRDATVWVRTINLGKSENDLQMRLAPTESASAAVNAGLEVSEQGGYWTISIAAEQTPINFSVRLASKDSDIDFDEFTAATEDLKELTKGGPKQWSDLLTRQSDGDQSGPFAVDTLTRPANNPWKSRLRMSGLDFYSDNDSLVACCCDGDVWKVSGLSRSDGELTWTRIASGLFHPLGIKIVDQRIFVTCRDQIVVLNDLNEDGEADFYQCFNNDHQVTDHFHEFAMGLQADEQGNLYYAKSARHARDSLVPQHGTLLKVNADGSETSIIANGFRAANGVCLNPDGSFFVTDQEGHWNPMNRINRVVPGGFYGNMYSYGAPDDSSDEAMEQPLCWPNKAFDRSPSELLWVQSDQWGPLNGSLLNLSYGYGKVFIVPHEEIDGQWQGGMCRLPLPRFPTGVMRARFHPTDGQMYACGMQAWGSDQDQSAGGLYRIRYTGVPANLPVKLHAHHAGVTIRFSDRISSKIAADPSNYLVETWDLKRTKNYGSDLYNEQVLPIASAKVSDDGHAVTLVIPEIKPTWCMNISYKLEDENGTQFLGTIQNTIHQLGGNDQ
ncbi:c-type cytochrome [Stieleria sp. JC731]|uniref:DUF6797 domain-containing protein n=1 Tax=Pirellulaceae TaxID=2691357 RepID=UPI001E377503|nr:DUF6797 domain-containing protein [Stieleria sp. JC731]MCC9601811.1 c-type cytochrome [Stieleria sp. JC731]